MELLQYNLTDNESLSMLKMPNIHYIDVKSNEQHQQDITGLTSLKVSGTSLFPGLSYNDRFIIRYYT
jgi:hypothetical protein